MRPFDHVFMETLQVGRINFRDRLVLLDTYEEAHDFLAVRQNTESIQRLLSKLADCEVSFSVSDSLQRGSCDCHFPFCKGVLVLKLLISGARFSVENFNRVETF
jgi:hypothetical protein